MFPDFDRGNRIKNVVELRDLFPTFLDVANGTDLVPKDINGSSLLALLDGNSTSVTQVRSFIHFAKILTMVKANRLLLISRYCSKFQCKTEHIN
mmetsp:Transcript_688/g.832  ORF Transcript_688/g.832 Transcript_688/m.832 type:complete len:94 (+) Transcript_688:1106-1387(+)